MSKMIELQIDKEDRILIISPHPDDESIGVGGLLARFPRQCTVVVATDGAKADQRVGSEEMKEKRSNEFSCAMKMAGVKEYQFLNYPDGELSCYPDCFKRIDFQSYTKIFLPHQNEAHSDHMSSFSFAQGEIYKRKLTHTEIFQYETRKPNEDADYYLDISDIIDIKQKMIRCYQSQIVLFDHATFAEAINHFQACKNGKGTGHYEAYTKVSASAKYHRTMSWYDKALARYKIENDIYEQWLRNKTNGVEIKQFLQERHWETVCIYGYGKLGKMLCRDLNKDKRRVLYILDRNSMLRVEESVPVFLPDHIGGVVDVVIITTIFDTGEIKDDLVKKGYTNVILLRDLLAEMNKGKNNEVE